MPAGRPRKSLPPSQDDIRLIVACKEERERLREELAVMRRLGPAYDDERAQIKRELHELSDRMLAVKFETTKWTVQGL